MLTTELQDTMLGEMQRYVNLGPVAPDWDDLVGDANRWSMDYTTQISRGIADNSQRIVGDIVRDARESGQSQAELAKRLTWRFGRAHAEMVAITETTRADAEAATALQNRLGEMDVRTQRRWLTGEDAKVCPLCVPFDHATADIGQPFTATNGQQAMNPPLHPRCRCQVVVEEMPAEEVPTGVPPETVAPKGPGPEQKFRTVDDPAAFNDKHYRDWVGTLSDQERASFRKYSGAHYSSINRQLRTGEIGRNAEIYTREIGHLTKAIDRGNIPEDIIVFRGRNAPRLADGTRMQPYQVNSLVGQVEEDAGFLSTSLDRNVVMDDFAKSGPEFQSLLYEVRVPKGTKAANMWDVSMSSMQSEAEILLQRGTKMKWLEVSEFVDRRGNKVTKVIAEVVQ